MLAVALLSYALPTLVGGNGYLSAYIAGIIIGNSKIPNKKKPGTFFRWYHGTDANDGIFSIGTALYAIQDAGSSVTCTRNCCFSDTSGTSDGGRLPADAISGKAAAAAAHILGGTAWCNLGYFCIDGCGGGCGTRI